MAADADVVGASAVASVIIGDRRNVFAANVTIMPVDAIALWPTDLMPRFTHDGLRAHVGQVLTTVKKRTVREMSAGELHGSTSRWVCFNTDPGELARAGCKATNAIHDDNRNIGAFTARVLASCSLRQILAEKTLERGPHSLKVFVLASTVRFTGKYYCTQCLSVRTMQDL